MKPQSPPTTPTPRLDAPVRLSLDALRFEMRCYLWAHGLASMTAMLAVVFWIALGFDWFFEPPPLLRIGVVAGGLFCLAAGLIEFIVRRVFVRLSDANLAMVLERRFPELRESLLTVVEPAAADGDADWPWREELLQRARHEACQRLSRLRVSAVFNPALLWLMIGIALILATSVLAVGWFGRVEVGIWARRTFLLSDELWPRRARLVIDGFRDGVAKVARGSDLELLAKADTQMPLIPEVVQIRYRIEGGGRGRVPMTRVGVADPRKDPFQDFTYTFRGLLSPIRFDLLGGDAILSNLRIEVVDSPTIQMSLRWQSPAYMRQPPREMPVTGTMQIPRGSEVTLLGHHANKDLVRVQIESPQDEQASAVETIELKGPDRRTFEYPIARLEKDCSLLVSLLDAEGIRSRDPIRVVLAASPDEAPRLALQLRGIGPAITPKARLPVEGRVSDDFGIARLWFEAGLDQQPAVQQPIAIAGEYATDLAVSAALNVESLGAKAGQKLLASVKASDHCDLTAEPNVGQGERWILEIVSPEQLRTLLEARELTLRQRFEAVIHEVGETRDLVARLNLARPDDLPADEAKPEGAAAGDKKPGTGEAAQPDGEPPLPADSPQRAASLRNLRVERAMQNARKNAHETLGIAESFEDIRLQLINNRIDTEELLDRLQNGIAQPMRRIAGQQFPELERRLEGLRAALDDIKLAERRREQVGAQLDAILVAMKQVLQRMLELENFNEAVELLRDIIRQQEHLDQQTKQRHKQRLRDLLKE